MQKRNGILGDIIKKAREEKNKTIESIANDVGISVRYLYWIENEGKKPSFDVLYRLIRELSISPDEIFYPEEQTKDSEIENLLRLLSDCDERALSVIKATAKAVLTYYR